MVNIAVLALGGYITTSVVLGSCLTYHDCKRCSYGYSNMNFSKKCKKMEEAINSGVLFINCIIAVPFTLVWIPIYCNKLLAKFISKGIVLASEIGNLEIKNKTPNND